MNNWAADKPTEREALFRQTASRMSGISPEIVEKDFWVCWTLHHLFELQDLPHLIFKGGTSLSKAFGIIKRFSEDIDLVLNRHELGFSAENDPANQTGSNLRNRTIDSLKEKCAVYLADQFIPKLRVQMSSVLVGTDWSLVADSNAPRSRHVRIHVSTWH